MKSYTDLWQSKRLAEILPIESADMSYQYFIPELAPDGYGISLDPVEYDDDIPCWSLAALLSVLPEPILTQFSEDKWNVAIFGKDNHFKDECFADEPVDACYEMIVRLHLNKEDRQ